MVRLSFLLDSLPLVVSAVTGAAVPEKRQATATSIYKFSGGAPQVENLAARANGQLILMRMDVAEVWGLNVTTKQASKLATLPGVTSTAGIGEISPDVFAVIGGQYSGGRNTAGSWGVFKLDLTGTTPQVSVIKMVKEATLLNGLAVFNNDTVLLGDAGKGAVYKVTVSTGEFSVLLADPTMTPQGSIPFGIDGLKYKDGFVYYTNIFKNTLLKFAVDNTTAEATGSVQTLYSNMPGDDFTFGSDEQIYLATNARNSVIKVNPLTGAYTNIASVSGSTSCAFGRTTADSKTLYVGTGSGSVMGVTIT